MCLKTLAAWLQVDQVVRILMTDDDPRAKSAKKYLKSHRDDVRAYLNDATQSFTDQIGILPKKLKQPKYHPVPHKFAELKAGDNPAKRKKLRGQFGKEIAEIHRLRINKRADNVKKAITSEQVIPF
jgi:hypothetical protein